MPPVCPSSRHYAPLSQQRSDSAAYRRAARSEPIRTRCGLAHILAHRVQTEQTRRPRIGEKKVNGTADMKAILGCTAFALAIAVATIPADARGCIKGAIVG